MEPKICIKNLTQIYGNNISEAKSLLHSGETRSEIFNKTGLTVGVDNVSLDIYPSEIMAIMGLSGSGKSTLLKCINRLLEPCEGQILIDGEDILQYNKQKLKMYRQQKTCMVFQEFGLLPHRTVLKNVEFGLEVAKVPKAERKEKAEQVIEIVGLKGWENVFPEELSGGMRQRVGLARALANEPDILLMDEPFSALDPLIRRQMQQELIELQKKLHKVIIFITHDINEAFYLGDRVAIMKDGQLQQVAKPTEILKHPATEYIKEFIKDVNKLQVLYCHDIMQPLDAETVEQNLPRVVFKDNLESAMKEMGGKSEMAYVTDENGSICGTLKMDDILTAVIRGL